MACLETTPNTDVGAWSHPLHNEWEFLGVGPTELHCLQLHQMSLCLLRLPPGKYYLYQMFSEATLISKAAQLWPDILYVHELWGTHCIQRKALSGLSLNSHRWSSSPWPTLLLFCMALSASTPQLVTYSSLFWFGLLVYDQIWLSGQFL